MRVWQIAFVVSVLAGCAMTQTEPKSAPVAQQVVEQGASTSVLDQDSRRFSPDFHHQTLSNYAEQLLLQFLNFENVDLPQRVAVVSFVSLSSSLQDTNVLGNQLADNLIVQMRHYGFEVLDIKTMAAIEIGRQGEFVFSRDVQKLSQNQRVDHVLSGTMTYRNNGVLINARIVEMGTNRVVASAQQLIPYFVVETLYKM